MTFSQQFIFHRPLLMSLLHLRSGLMRPSLTLWMLRPKCSPYTTPGQQGSWAYTSPMWHRALSGILELVPVYEWVRMKQLCWYSQLI